MTACNRSQSLLNPERTASVLSAPQPSGLCCVKISCLTVDVRASYISVFYAQITENSFDAALSNREMYEPITAHRFL